MRRLLLPSSSVAYGNVTYRGVGARDAQNNAAITPPFPSGAVVGDWLYTFVFYSSANGTVATPIGWALMDGTPFGGSTGDLYIYTRQYQSGDTAPTYTVSGGSTGDGVVGGCLAFAGSRGTVAVGGNTVTAVQRDIPVVAPSAAGIVNGAVVMVGARDVGYCVATPLSGDGLSWIETMDFSNGGWKTYLVCDVAVWNGPPPTITDKVFTLSALTGVCFSKGFVVGPAAI